MTEPTIDLPDEPASLALGAALADLVARVFVEDAPATGFTIHLSGDLGAGKTTLARALLRRLGVTGRIKSPTYTLVEPYVVEIATGSVESRQRLNLYCYHFDFYRLESPREWLDAGFRHHFTDAALRLVEWPERARADSGSVLPAPDLHVTLADAGDGRRAHVVAGTSQGDAWLSRADLAAAVRDAADSSRAD